MKETDDDLNFDFLPSRRRRQLAPEVAKLRRIKSKAEIDPIKQAADISATAHAKVRRNPLLSGALDLLGGTLTVLQTMQFTKPSRKEFDLQAHFEYQYALQGCERPAYVPVVASG